MLSSHEGGGNQDLMSNEVDPDSVPEWFLREVLMDLMERMTRYTPPPFMMSQYRNEYIDPFERIPLKIPTELITQSNSTTSTQSQPTVQKKDDTRMAQRSAKEQLEQDDRLKKMTIERTGTKLIVPDGIEIDTAIKALTLKQQEEEQVVSINHTLPVEVAEGMVAFLRVLEREYGFVTNTGTVSFFGRNPPQYLGIETSPGKRESIPIGNLQIPGITGYLSPTFGIQMDRAVFRVEGECKGKDRHKVDHILAMVEEECRHNSIYRGHAITTSFPEVDETSSLEDTFPRFTTLSTTNPEDVVFSSATEEEITVSLFTPITRTADCRTNKIPLKRGILLEGPYGTGKTLVAAATATLCAKNGWTFIYLKDVTRLAQAYAFAAQYQPCLIFAEDIDQVLKDVGRRDEEVNQILNALDGIDSRGLEVITVLTTNHIEKITRAMLRPGRLDTVVSVRPADKDAAVRLVRLYAGDLLDPTCDFESSGVGDVLAGISPAIIREVVERSKLAAIRREGALRLTPEDIRVTARSMKTHMKLLEPVDPDNRSDREKAAQIIADGQVRAASVSSRGTESESKEAPHNGKGKIPAHEHTPAIPNG